MRIKTKMLKRLISVLCAATMVASGAVVSVGAIETWVDKRNAITDISIETAEIDINELKKQLNCSKVSPKIKDEFFELTKLGYDKLKEYIRDNVDEYINVVSKVKPKFRLLLVADKNNKYTGKEKSRLASLDEVVTQALVKKRRLVKDFDKAYRNFSLEKDKFYRWAKKHGNSKTAGQLQDVWDGLLQLEKRYKSSEASEMNNFIKLINDSNNDLENWMSDFEKKEKEENRKERQRQAYKNDINERKEREEKNEKIEKETKRENTERMERKKARREKVEKKIDELKKKINSLHKLVNNSKELRKQYSSQLKGYSNKLSYYLNLVRDYQPSKVEYALENIEKSINKLDQIKGDIQDAIQYELRASKQQNNIIVEEEIEEEKSDKIEEKSGEELKEQNCCITEGKNEEMSDEESKQEYNNTNPNDPLYEIYKNPSVGKDIKENLDYWSDIINDFMKIDESRELTPGQYDTLGTCARLEMAALKKLIAKDIIKKDAKIKGEIEYLKFIIERVNKALKQVGYGHENTDSRCNGHMVNYTIRTL